MGYVLIQRERWERAKEEYPHRFVIYGPFYQVECEWCSELSGCFEDSSEAEKWQDEHTCSVADVTEER